jgi:hypothetical protein
MSVRFSGINFSDEIPVKLAAAQPLLIKFWDKLSQSIGYNNLTYIFTMRFENKAKSLAIVRTAVLQLEDSLIRGNIEISYLFI